MIIGVTYRASASSLSANVRVNALSIPSTLYVFSSCCCAWYTAPISHTANRAPVSPIVSSLVASSHLQTVRHRYHRILDLRKFRQMVADGRIPPEVFMTVRSGSTEQLLRYISDEAHIVDYFKDYVDTKARQRVRHPLRFWFVYHFLWR